MSDFTRTPTTISNIGVVMFAVTDQDAALAFYTKKLGFEVRGDTRFGENAEMRWLEVAPPGSRTRLALNPPMGGQPGGSTRLVWRRRTSWASTPALALSAASTSIRSQCAHSAPHWCLCCATRTATSSSWWKSRPPHNSTTAGSGNVHDSNFRRRRGRNVVAR
jgi:hypothetical protein